MGLSILSIMLFHQYFIKNPIFSIFHNYGYWGVDVFLFLSGIGLVRSIESYSTSRFYSRRFFRIIPSCIFCGVIKYVAFVLMLSSLGHLKLGLHLGWWSVVSLDLWFVYTIILLYLFSPFIYKCLVKIPILTIVIVIAMFLMNGFFVRDNVGYNWFSPIGIISWSLERLPVFVWGMTIAIYKNINKDKIVYYSFVSLFFAIILVAIQKYIMPDAIGGRAVIFTFLSFGILAVVIVNIQLLKRIPSIIVSIFNFLGILSLELYLVHEFLFNIFLLKNNCNSYVLFLISFLFSILVAYLCKFVIDKFLVFVGVK